ncbi:hypothetical protein CL617_05800 [archaeon]|nr:hypothetical protein [archaeon]|tara:strand:- start:9425 stop:9946 length:522 start_codon:yes stop_codon:yes gene_type:complete
MKQKNTQSKKGNSEVYLIDNISKQSCQCHGFRDFSTKYFYFPPKKFDIHRSFTTEEFSINIPQYYASLFNHDETIKNGSREIETSTRSEYPEIGGGVYSKRKATYTITEGRIIKNRLLDDINLIQKILNLYTETNELDEKSNGYLEFLHNIKEENIQIQIIDIFQSLESLIEN